MLENIMLISSSKKEQMVRRHHDRKPPPSKSRWLERHVVASFMNKKRANMFSNDFRVVVGHLLPRDKIKDASTCLDYV